MGGIMSLAQLLPHVGIVIAIVLATELIKSFDRTDRFKGWYVVIPLVLGAAAGWPISLSLGKPEWYHIVLYSFLYAAVAGYLWKFLKDVILARLKASIGQ